MDDFYYISYKAIKNNFLMCKKINRLYVKSFLHNIVTLENNMKKFEMIIDQDNKEEMNFIKIKRFVNLFLLDDDQILEYVKQNAKKFKKKDIECYLEIRMIDNKRDFPV